ncbi:hypothetical protein EHS13_28320 [Paenibacillus psychroresistens]|uniref:Beta-glucosidase n=1 Tax=Paenibacillus psychroresistens TaxID=1778678 RepID=A0A6B8RRL6_9BACL|nr:GH116 family glycosyl-hydrolase [Paenibacillus psychroresistens]QGQ98507.1 hypothetical protein EHS13_28320 [Paenibacillus psychroresistens]
MSSFEYKGVKTKQISFPLGGLGTGCIGLAGNGDLIDWEIYNKPNKGGTNDFTHFAVKAEANGKLVDARILAGDLGPPYMGGMRGPKTNLFGFGPSRATMAGVPHFKNLTFTGEFPIATVLYSDEYFPGEITLTAFNPFIPLNDADSSIPGAFFELEVTNTAAEEMTYTFCLSLNNPLTKGTTINTYQKTDSTHLIKLASSKHTEAEFGYGDLTLATDGETVSYQEYWYRGGGVDNVETFWREFTAVEPLRNRNYAVAGTDATDDVCSMTVSIIIPAGECRKTRYMIAWNFPNCHNYWNLESPTEPLKIWKNYYASLFADSTESARYGLNNWERLFAETLAFKKALFNSTLPEAAIEAISANISILKSPTSLRLEDGSFYGWEGCFPDTGSCEGTCSHVWNYAYALPFLFPKLERSIRNLDYQYNLRDSGSMAFRLQLPLGRERFSFRACVDGQMGGVIKAYRDWKISGDTVWLKSIWEPLKKSLEFAWSPENEDYWDEHKTGVISGVQHHTLDVEMFGANSWLNGFYLAALKAASEMADHLGEADKALEYGQLFERGKQWTDENLFNGAYYYQKIDLKDKTLLDRLQAGESLMGKNTDDVYWNSEAEEIKYQIGEGCGIDQVVAQWHANLCGLGEIFDRNQTRQALQSIYKHNFKKSMREVFNPWRIFSINDEAGTMICDWPEGAVKPAIPLSYAQETMSGFEYQFAVHLIQEGFIDQGVEVVKAIRDRYDGEKRNPWNEIEHGSNYSRSMASYALLNAFSGFEFNLPLQMIGFNPVQLDEQGSFQSFWSLDSAWGVFSIQPGRVELSVLYGELTLKELKLAFLAGVEVTGISLEGEAIPFIRNSISLLFSQADTISKDSSLVIEHE